MTNIYSGDNVITVSDDINTYIDAGIRENLTFVEVKQEQTSTSSFIAFYFENDNGDKVSHTEYKIQPRKPVAQLTTDELLTLSKRSAMQLGKIKQIVSAIKGFSPEEEKAYNFSNANSFEAIAAKAKNDTISLVNIAKVRAKVVYNYKGFTSLDNNPHYRFIENMNVVPTKETSKIRILSSDRMTRDNVKQTNFKATANPFVGESATTAPDTSGTANDDGLPF